jgi:multicomponent Na+:H+ antiporter subunit A
MWLGPAILAVAGIVVGLMPDGVTPSLIAPATGAVLGRPTPVDLYLWHGFNAALGLSILSVVAGLLLYGGWAALRRSTSWVERSFSWGPAWWYGAALGGLTRLAGAVTGLLQSGLLRAYLLITLLSSVGLVGATLLGRAALPTGLPRSDFRFYEVIIAAVILLAAVAAVFARSRLSAVASLGVVGSGISVLYILYGAPDLAMTQVLVETLTVILFVFVFFHLPRFPLRSSRAVRLFDAGVATAVGGLMAVLVLAATATPPASQLAPFFAENSKPLAHGGNIVNVILVDFRGLDTLGEITVLSVAAIGVFALLRLRPRKGPGQ